MDFDGADRAPGTAIRTTPPTARSAGRPASSGAVASAAPDIRPVPPVPAPARAVAPGPSSLETAGATIPSTSVFKPDTIEPRTRRLPVGRFFKWVLTAFALFLGFTLLSMLVYRFVDPPFTPVIAVSRLIGEPVDQRWTPLSRISPNLVRAVVASEDARFCSHSGIDFGELAAAIEETRRGHPRGASTITMQVVKNLFLWPSRSVVRKAFELPLALVLDALWSKERILEVYLNIAEWGPGIYGAEAAARTSFGKPASRLGVREAARLAVSLPNPADRDAGDPDRTVERLASRLEARMRGTIALGCLRRR
jgi:monofunctional biosynthetic peptidoglycan transglycosylase